MPVFQGWEPQGDPVAHGSGCRIYIASGDLSFETTPYISFERISLPPHSEEDAAFTKDGVDHDRVVVNEHGVRARRVCDPKKLPHGATKQPGTWTTIELYGASFAVRIDAPSLATTEYGFDRARFAELVIRSAVL